MLLPSRYLKKLWPVVGLLVLGAALFPRVHATAQQAKPPELPAAVLRVTTRLVLVDVVVLDNQGRPVTDLTRDDFTLLENGQPQRIATFSLEQPAQRVRERGEPPPLPPHVYTNRPEYRMPPGPLTVLLLDALNTPQQDQAYAREQILRYLRTQLQPDQRTAILALTNDLLLLQDFTTDPRLLQAALEKYTPQRSAQLSRDEALINPETLARIADLNTRVAESIQRFEEEVAAAATDARVATTLAALQAIARATAGYPGRKNLIWVSASFPFSLAPENAENFSASRLYADELRRTASALSDAQVAVYPVDARGLVGYSMASAADSGRGRRGGVRAGPDFGGELSRRSTQLANTIFTMRQLAEDTGGRAFVNRNDIDAAVALGVADGSTYYTLGFYPEDKQWDGKFRRLRVKVARKGLGVRYRRGYFALDPARRRPPPRDKRKELSEEQARELEREQDLKAALASPLPATLVTFRAHVPPSAGVRVQVEFAVDAHTLLFEEVEEGRQHADVDFLVAAVSAGGKVIRTASETVEARLLPETFARVQQEGLPYRMEMELEPGRYQLRLIVRDNRTGMVGTTDVPVEVTPP